MLLNRPVLPCPVGARSGGSRRLILVVKLRYRKRWHLVIIQVAILCVMLLSRHVHCLVLENQSLFSCNHLLVRILVTVHLWRLRFLHRNRQKITTAWRVKIYQRFRPYRTLRKARLLLHTSLHISLNNISWHFLALDYLMHG